MKKEELLELGIDEEVAKQVMALHGKTVTQLNAKLAAAESERDSAQNELTANKEEFDKLKEAAQGNEELTKQLADLDAQFKQNEAEKDKQLASMKKNYSIRLALKDANPLDEDIVFSQLDTDAINLTDDGLNGLKEQLDSLKEKKGFLFKQEEQQQQQQQQSGRVNFSGNATPPGSNSSDPFEKIKAKYQK